MVNLLPRYFGRKPSAEHFGTSSYRISVPKSQQRWFPEKAGFFVVVW